MASSEYLVPVERTSRRPIPLHRPSKEFQELLRLDYGRCKLDDLTLPETISLEMASLVQEHYRAADLEKLGLPVRRSLLLVGREGSGKLTTAQALAATLEFPIYYLQPPLWASVGEIELEERWSPARP